MKEEVDVAHPKQLPRESINAFNPSSSFSASRLLRLFGDLIRHQRAPADEPST